jgi:hypothetical protein
MRTYLRGGLFALALLGVLSGARLLRAQVHGLAYSRGQNVVPVFEGWEPNKDGTSNMVFGYMNRNYDEELNIAPGADNRIEPGGPDQGQPTYFYPRRQQFVLRVKVPKDWGTKDLVWAITSHGVTEKAYGSLKPIYMIDRELIVKNSVPGARLEVLDSNEPPSLVIDPLPRASVSSRVPLTLSATDDGVPAVRPRPGRAMSGQEPIVLNAPLKEVPRPLPGLSYSWILYRGPAKVQFTPSGYTAIKSGAKAVTTAQFSVAGTYVLRALVSDSILETTKDVTLVVSEAPTP